MNEFDAIANDEVVKSVHWQTPMNRRQFMRAAAIAGAAALATGCAPQIVEKM